MNPLRSGQSSNSVVPRRVNEHGRRSQFTADEMIDTRHVLAGRRQRVLVPNLASPGLTMRGEFDPNQIYNLNDLTLRTLGSNAGAWIYISATPSTGSGGTNPTVSRGSTLTVPGLKSAPEPADGSEPKTKLS